MDNKNFDFEAKDVSIENVRGSEDKYQLDQAGFQFFKKDTSVKEFGDDDAVKAAYYPEVEALLKELTGASRVVVCMTTVRRLQLLLSLNLALHCLIKYF